MDYKEETFSEHANSEETLSDFRKRMIEMALSDESGIVQYVLDGEVMPADFQLKEGDKQRLAEGSVCEFRRKVVI